MTSNIIVLTTTHKQSMGLYSRLLELNNEFKNIPCFIKEDLQEKSDIKYIFSTWEMPKFSKEEVANYFPELEAIFYVGGSVKNFATPFFSQGVRIFSAAEMNSIPVAEFTLANILLANKGYHSCMSKYKFPIWKKGYFKLRNISSSHSGNYKSSVGILGCGAIGSRVVEMLNRFDLEIKVYDPYVATDKIWGMGAQPASLKEIFQTCNVISNHMPDTKETRGIIDKNLITSMRKYSTLINTGRGRQINENDLCKVLKKRNDLTAILDVSTHEPPFPWSKLYHRNNIHLSPHIAGSMGCEINRMIDFIYDGFIKYRQSREAPGEVFENDLNNKA